MQHIEEQKKEQPILSRREALKTLAAASGAATLSLLPQHWEKPVIEVGTLPAHAQASPSLTISNLSETFTGVNNCATSAGLGSRSTVRFDYNDPQGQVGAGTEVHEQTTFSPSGLTNSAIYTGSALTISGDGFTGTISYEPCTRFNGDTSVTTTVSIRTADGRISETATTTTQAPIGAEETEGSPGTRTL